MRCARAQSVEQGSAEWFAAREGRITARRARSDDASQHAALTRCWRTHTPALLRHSVFATAVGLSSYCSARSLWAYQTGRVGGGERWAGNEHTARGTAGESAARDEYTRLTGNAVAPCGLFVHPQHAWLAASPDGLLLDDGLLEIKCPVRLHDTLPPLYMPQVQGQLAIAGRAWAHFFSFVADGAPGGGPAAALFRVARSEAYWAWMLPRLRTFHACVQADVEPGDELVVTPAGQPPPVEVLCLGRWG